MFIILLLSTYLSLGYQSIINNGLYSLPSYNIWKVLYTNLSKTQSPELQKCVHSHSSSSKKYELMSSINIYEGDSIAYPAIIRYCNQYYTLNGHLIAKFAENKHFISSTRSQATYFAEVITTKGDFSVVSIKKLISKNKKVMLEEQAILNISKSYGQITAFSHSFSLSLKLFAFTTISDQLLFYKLDGKLQSSVQFPLSDLNDNYVRIAKLNIQLAVYSSSVSNRSFLYTISTNGKNSTLKKYVLPKLQNALGQRMQVKFSDQNWNQLFLRAGSKVYVYDLSTSKPEQEPKSSFKLLTDDDEFYIAGNMMIIQPNQTKSLIFNYSDRLRLYYNLTSGKALQLSLPIIQCQQPTHIQPCSQSSLNQLLCSFCQHSFQCYSFTSSLDGASSQKLDYTDYSKFRVPLVLLSLGVVIFISVTRSRKNKSTDEQREQEMFMKELQVRDKALFEQLRRNKRTNPEPKQMR